MPCPGQGCPHRLAGTRHREALCPQGALVTVNSSGFAAVAGHWWGRGKVPAPCCPLPPFCTSHFPPLPSPCPPKPLSAEGTCAVCPSSLPRSVSPAWSYSAVDTVVAVAGAVLGAGRIWGIPGRESRGAIPFPTPCVPLQTMTPTARWMTGTAITAVRPATASRRRTTPPPSPTPPSTSTP